MSEGHVTIPDTALRVLVTPSQSSYFAGEPLSVTITITNTRSPQVQVVAPPRSTHKRSAHSVSSARLARPPTSPGLPKSPFSTLLRSAPPKPSAPTRKGLVGTTPPKNGSQSQSISERRVAVRSLSVDIPPHEFPRSLQDDTKMSQIHAARRAGGSSSSRVKRTAQIRRAKLTSRVIPISPFILHAPAFKSPTCSQGLNRRWSSFNPAERFSLFVHAFTRSNRRKHVSHPTHTSISLACPHASPFRFSSRRR